MLLKPLLELDRTELRRDRIALWHGAGSIERILRGRLRVILKRGYLIRAQRAAVHAHVGQAAVEVVVLP